MMLFNFEKMKHLIVAAAILTGVSTQLHARELTANTIRGTAVSRINSVMLGNRIVLNKRVASPLCRSGYVHANQGDGCREAMAGAHIDSCYGEAAAESWWSCSLPEGEVSCPDGGEIEFGPTYYSCSYGDSKVKPNFACAAGYSVVVGEFCGPQGEYCCYKSGNPCGAGADFWATAEGEACCAVWRDGPC